MQLFQNAFEPEIAMPLSQRGPIERWNHRKSQRIRYRRLAAVPEFLQIQQIFRPARGLLVFDQIVESKHPHRQSIELLIPVRRSMRWTA
jgi:hypothetical protein